MKTSALIISAFIISFQSIAQTSAVKKVLMEEFTTTLCGFCPPKSKEIIQFHEDHPTNTLFMTHHAGFGVDSMTTPQASAFASYFQPSTFGFAPAIMIDRDVYPWVDSVPYMSVNGFDTIATTVMQQQAIVGITFSGNYDLVSRNLSLTVSSWFTQIPPAGELRLNVYFVEDSVLGSGNGWDQKCYDANWANQYYPGQYNSTTTYISNYPHRYVQRGPVGGGTWGPAGVIPINPVMGTNYDYTINTIIPQNFNADRLKIIAFVANYGSTKMDRNVLNANDVKLSDLSSTSLLSVDIKSPILLFPNPASEYIMISSDELFYDDEAELLILDIQGRIIDKRVLVIPGKTNITISCNHLKEGAYLVSIRNGSKLFYSPLLISR